MSENSIAISFSFLNIIYIKAISIVEHSYLVKCVLYDIMYITYNSITLQVFVFMTSLHYT